MIKCINNNSIETLNIDKEIITKLNKNNITTIEKLWI